MNFHKTIGFLATLLLTLGLGVPDSFAQNVESLILSAAPNTFTDAENSQNVTVTADITLDAVVAGSDATVTVALTANTDDISPDAAAEGTDYIIPQNLPSITVIIPVGDQTGSGSRFF